MAASKIGPELDVNTTTAGTQYEQQIVTLSDGRFVVTWWDHSGVGASLSSGLAGAEIKAQLYAANGARIGSEISVSVDTPGQTTASDFQYEPQITELSGGGFVATWWSSEGGGTIHARVFGANGLPVAGDDFTVNSTAGVAHFLNPKITPLDNGGFVVTWSSTENTGDIRARIFDANGVAAGADFRVNTTTVGNQRIPEITTLEGGRFVVTWRTDDGSGTDDIRARVFNENGTPASAELAINVATAGLQTNPQITALSGGGFAIAWEDGSFSAFANGSLGVGGATGDNSGSAIKARVYTANGVPTSSEILVNTATVGVQLDPRITPLTNGGFVVVWQDGTVLADGSRGVGGAGGDSSGNAIKAQIFSATGARVGSEILVNTAVVNNQTDPQVTALDGGGFVVTWTDGSLGVGGAGGDDNCEAVKAQVFGADGTRIGGEILVNTTIEFFQISPQITSLPGNDFVITWLDSSNLVDFEVQAQVFSADGGGSGGGVNLDGTAGNDTLVGTASADTLNGFGGNDTFNAGAGNDTINGGAGFDQAIINGPSEGVSWSFDGRPLDEVRITSTDGTDTLRLVERVIFNDRILAFDNDGNAGQSYRIYQAAFDRVPDRPGLSYWVNQMDDGMALTQVALNFILSPEFAATYGNISTMSNAEFLNVVYLNVLGRAPDTAGFNYWMNDLANGYPRHFLLTGFSESLENQNNVAQAIRGGIVLELSAFL